MNCKNCESQLAQDNSFCGNCGAKIITERITVKSLFSTLLGTLGWESNIILALRYTLFKPHVIFEEYINGTRKKYANPFTFFAISLAISLFVFSSYSEQFIEITSNLSLQDGSTLSEAEKGPFKQEIFGYKNQYEFRKGLMLFQMKYYNLISFLLLPFYTLISFLVFRKPYNYGEHLVINTYLQSLLTLLSTLLFLITLITGFNVFGVGIFLVPFLLYSFAYKMLYKFTFVQLLKKILKFIGVLLLCFIVLIITLVVIAFISVAMS